jgi:hypothetical protein
MSVGTGRQNIIILFWKLQFNFWEYINGNDIYIGFSTALHLQCAHYAGEGEIGLFLKQRCRMASWQLGLVWSAAEQRFIILLDTLFMFEKDKRYCIFLLYSHGWAYLWLPTHLLTGQCFSHGNFRLIISQREG